MKLAGLILLTSAGLLAAFSAENLSPGLASRETKARIREGLPAYQAPPPKADSALSSDTDSAPGNDVLILPKITVKEKRLPPDAADHLMSKRDFNRKMTNLYDDTVAEGGPLNVILNYFTIPLLSPSKAQRGQAIYRAKEIERLEQVVEVSKLLDPEAEKKFKREMDNSWTTRLPGRK